MARFAVFVTLAIVFAVTVSVTEAISCGQVASSITSCIPYAQGKGTAPSAACCNGVKSLNSAAKSTADRQAACNCLKKQAGAINGLNNGNVASIPRKCGVSIPYVISTSTDCSKVR
ncbi:hypothetical protein LUZ60_015434 [Juncus effusus]|nr:hypothetical protein LUZ60_015434 [Juncus effusus]